MGVILGLCLPARVRVRVAEPTGYRYGTVVMPAMPEVDRGAYPYAAMTADSGSLAYLVFSNVPLRYDGEPIVKMYYGVEAGRSVVYHCEPASTGFTWERDPDRDLTFAAGEKAFQTTFTTHKWSEYDMYDNDTGSLVQAGSEPDPVYGEVQSA